MKSEHLHLILAILNTTVGVACVLSFNVAALLIGLMALSFGIWQWVVYLIIRT